MVNITYGQISSGSTWGDAVVNPSGTVSQTSVSES